QNVPPVRFIDDHLVEVDSREQTSSLLGGSRSRMVHEDLTHGPGGYSKEMEPTLPRSCARLYQTEVGFMKHGCRLKGMAGPFVLEMRGSDPAQMGIDQGHQLRGGLVIAPVKVGKMRRDALGRRPGL